ncbi:MAG: hypothetical protein QNJ29_10220 [Rhizobiaceae bacterium]|nr:hypothetical protein [Rhizobiaceae bacterium]
MKLSSKFTTLATVLALSTTAAFAQGFSNGRTPAGETSAEQINPPHNGGIASQGFGGAALGSGQLWAYINANGTRARDKGSSNSIKLGGVGQYDVRFFRNVRPCAYMGIIAGATTGVAQGTISVVQRSGVANGVFVQTRNLAGNLADLPFAVFVDC